MTKKEKTAPVKEEKKTKSVISAVRKKAYGKSQSCDDEVALRFQAALEDKTLDELATENGIDLARWSHLNYGMQRMNLSNVLRGMIRRDETVVLNGVSVNFG